jgi:aminopeptidase-like protein
MNLHSEHRQIDPVDPGSRSSDPGAELHALVARLYPIPRSLTGPGVRATLDVLDEIAPILRTEIPTGTAVLDWTIPDEWTLREAYVARADNGERVIDAAKCNLHVLGYSEPVRARLSLAALKEHLFTHPERADVIPYRTSYYERRWGFCLRRDQLEALSDTDYDVVIDATLGPGHLTYGEHVRPGMTSDEVLLTTHICHPALANDNCSGMAVLAFLARSLAGRKTRYTYRFVFAPGSIGAIAWLARNRERVGRIRAGIVVSCLGDGGGPTFKKSRRGDSLTDRAMAAVLDQAGLPAVIEEFSPYGYDERQYCSPGFDLPVGSLQRSRWGRFPEYHTSADDLAFVRPEHLAQSLGLLADFVDVLERDRVMLNLQPYGEPQLGRRGLYAAVGGDPRVAARQMAMLWVLNLCDGTRSLIDVARRAGLPFSDIAATADLLEAHGLLQTIQDVPDRAPRA